MRFITRNYFHRAVFIKDWVEKKIRRHMARARNRKGFGWKR